MADSHPAALDADLDSQRLALLRRKLEARGLKSQPERNGGGAPVMTPAMTEAQLRMWFGQFADPTGALLNVCVSFSLTGPVDTERLRTAVAAVAARHPLLRTTYRSDDEGTPRPEVHADLLPGWNEHDLTSLGADERRARLESIAAAEYRAPFDLTVDAPLRITAVRLAAEETVLLLVAHHIAWDDASWQVFFADLTDAYVGAPARPLPNAGHPGPPGDDAGDLAYWRAQLADPPEPLELPGPRGSAVPTTWQASRHVIRLGDKTIDGVLALARELGSTPYGVLLAAFSAVLQRYTHTDDFLVAAPVLNRDDTQGIGYYGNTVALRMRPHAQQTFRDLAARARDTTQGAFAHQRIPMDRVVADINPDRRYGVDRMTRVSFAFREPDGPGFRPPGVVCRRAELRSDLAQVPLTFMVEFDARNPAAGAEVEVEYLVDVLDDALARQLLDSFAILLDDALADPDRRLAQLDVMSPDDRAWLDAASRGEVYDVPAATIGQLVADQVARTPDDTAVVQDDRRFSYRDIDQAANRLAHWLIEQGVGLERRVAVVMDKSPELVITALGILKAGAVYTPVDPTSPTDRIDYMLADCDAALVIREPVTGLEHYPADEPETAVQPSNTAYLIYTSGSTGLPKGVPVPHAPVTEYFRWFGDEYRVGSDDRLLQVASPGFDISIGEIFGTLACGARLVIPKADGLRDIAYLTDLLQREGITSMHFVPSLLGLFLSLPGVEQWRTLRRVPIGGEPLPAELADRFHATFDALLHNFYGPTETIINATRYPLSGPQGSRIVPIGKPKINTTAHLLDAALQPVPKGVIGELYLGGTHVAHGYQHRSALTAERFVADPFRPGQRLYRSGDLAWRDDAGDLVFVGRADEQVKIRGFRIELGEVAAPISPDPSVDQVVVLARELPSLGRSLVAYVTPAGGGTVDVTRIKANVAATLPDYMRPAAYVVVDEIPITANGKIDRDALPEPELAPVTEYREPTTDTERVIAGLYERLLDRDKVGADDSFFDLGGHSLVATRLIAAIRTACGVEVNVRDVFEAGTVAKLADVVDRRALDDQSPRRPALAPVAHDGPAPLSPAQLRSWFAYRVEGPNPVNNIPFAAELTGPCDVEALRAAVRDVVDRHEILRTTYLEVDGIPRQVVNPADLDVRHVVGSGSDWYATILDEERRHCFDLERELPVRAVVCSGPDRHVLSLVVHHIAADHWSAGVLLADLLTAYRARAEGQAPGWAPLALQYRDYAAWQSALLAPDGDVVSGQTEYWTNRLEGMPAEVGVESDVPRPAALSGTAGEVEFVIDAATRSKLATLSRELGVTEFMVLQAAVAVVLNQAGAGKDIPIGTPVAGRSDAALDQLVGFFINILVLRNDLSGNPTLREVLGRTRDTALGAYANQELPFDRVVDAVRPARSLSRNPLFSVVVHVREHWALSGAIDGTSFTALQPTFDMAHADLSVNFFATQDAYTGSLIYRSELYRPETAARLARWLTTVLSAFADSPDLTLRELSVLDETERALVLDEWGRGEVYVLDDALRPTPPGVVGELYYAGGQVTRGTSQLAGSTAVRFVANPYGAPGTRLHRTGERARWTADGLLELFDPIVQAAPSSSPSVATAVVGTSGAVHPPRTDTERALAAVLEDLLDVHDVGRPDDFFMLGGDSILAVQLAARARAEGLAINPRMVFEYPTLEELAAAIDTGQAAPTEDVRHEPMSVSGLSADDLAALQASFSTSPDS